MSQESRIETSMVDLGSADGKEEIARMEHLLRQQVKQCESLLEKSPQGKC